MKILIVRGGALGDFIVTLPTLRLLRERFPHAHIELLGHPHLAEMALKRHYLDAARSVDRGPLSTFFTPRAVLDPEWMDYFGSFDLVLSYFYDPDGLFKQNVERCEPGRLLTHTPRVPDRFDGPAARHFAGILAPLGVTGLDNEASELFPLATDLEAAQAFLGGVDAGTRLAAIHPGSGGESKKWPAESWAELGRRLVQSDSRVTLLLIEGEADAEPARHVLEAWKDLPHLRARLLPLPILAAVLQRATIYLGHDSGITHLAAAARRDLPIVALFGPTDPTVWAPPRPGVHVLRAETAVSSLRVEDVLAAASKALQAAVR